MTWDPFRSVKGYRLLISYPVVFDDDSDGAPIVGNLRLPKDLTQEEAERVKAMVDSLVLGERGVNV